MLSETIRINKTVIVFSDEIFDDMKKRSEHYFSIFIDKDENKLAFKSTKEPKNNFVFLEDRKGIVRTDFLKKQIKMIEGDYTAIVDEEGKWIIENCFVKEKEHKENKENKRKYKSGRAIAQDEISVQKSGFFFPEYVTNHPLRKGKERMEKIIEESKTDYDLILFKPTLNIIDGRKLTLNKKTLYFLTKLKDYVFGKYKFTVTNEGFLVKVPKKKE